MTKLKTRNISIDTSFIESQNFLAGTKIFELSKLAKDGLIKLFITDITYREIISRFRKNMIVTEEKIKKPRKELESNARILRNFEELKFYFELPTWEIEDLCSKFQKKLDTWIGETNIQVIKTGHINISHVFDDYFNNKPPFHKEQKKHEFPDAFTFKALEEYFKKDSTYFLTGDNDFEGFESTFIFPIQEAATLIDLVIRSESDRKDLDLAIELIDKHFEEEKDGLEKAIYDLIESYIKDEVGGMVEYDNIRVQSLNYAEVLDLKLHPFSIVHLDSKKAKLEIDITFSFRVSFSGINTASEWYDHANQFWHLPGEEDFLIEDTYDSNCTFTATIDLKNKSVEFDIESINGGKDLNVFSSFYL